jgi:hypothetical protein
MPLKKLGTGQGFLKAGLLGFQGSGKTYTATLLAVAVKRMFKLKGPIAFVDSENATEYVAPLVKSLTGDDLVGDRTRDFEQLLDLAYECQKEGISVLIADSMTHYWRSLCKAYLDGVNEGRERKGQQPRTRLEFADWNPIKDQWGKWTEFYLNSPLHIIICGRAGFEYDMTKNEETGRKELEKVGIKMKTEGEFGFEPSLLVQMELDQRPNKDGRFDQVRTALVLKDRFGSTDGYLFEFGRKETRELEVAAVASAFGPHLNMLIPGAHSTVNISQSPMAVSEEGDVDWARERKARTILTEEIQGIMVSKYPGQTADEKKAKADLLAKVFNTRSWTAVESMNSGVLRTGLAAMKKELGMEDPPPPEPKKPTNAFGIDEAEEAKQGLAPQEPAPKPQEPAPAAQEPSAFNPSKYMRLMAADKKVTEGEVLGALKELGAVEFWYQSFEELQIENPTAFDALQKEIKAMIDRIVKAKEGK